MKFRLLEQIGYTYAPENPELHGYDLELDAFEIYDRLKQNFSVEELANILVEYKFLTQEDIAGDYDLEDLVSNCIVYNMNIYDLMGILEFRELVDNYIEDEESQLLLDIEDSRSFKDTHGPEI